MLAHTKTELYKSIFWDFDLKVWGQNSKIYFLKTDEKNIEKKCLKVFVSKLKQKSQKIGWRQSDISKFQGVNWSKRYFWISFMKFFLEKYSVNWKKLSPLKLTWISLNIFMSGFRKLVQTIHESPILEILSPTENFSSAQ
jgi:hypothetical protein